MYSAAIAQVLRSAQDDNPYFRMTIRNDDNNDDHRSIAIRVREFPYTILGWDGRRFRSRAAGRLRWLSLIDA